MSQDHNEVLGLQPSENMLFSFRYGVGSIGPEVPPMELAKHEQERERPQGIRLPRNFKAAAFKVRPCALWTVIAKADAI